MGLRTKILGAMALVLAISVGGSFFILIRYQRAQLLRNTSQATAHLANTIRETLEHAMLANDPAEIRRIVLTVGRQPGIEGVFILDPAGAVKVTSKPDQAGRLLAGGPPSVGAGRSETGAAGTGTIVLERQPSPLLRSTSLIPNTTRCQGCHDSRQRVLGALVVDRSLQTMEDQLQTNLAFMVGSAGLAFLLLTVTTYAVFRYLVVTPLTTLGEAARAIEAGKYDTPLTLQRPDEVGELARALDGMRCRILEHLDEVRRWGEELEIRVAERTKELRQSQAAIVERERQIAALEAVRAATVTLSHHINNATAGIAGCRDVLASTLGEKADWQLRYALDGIQVSVKKITAVLQALRDLTRIDLTRFPGGLEAIDVDHAIQEGLARLDPDQPQPGKGSPRPQV
ncbi:MAG: HAMP domain-containing protein [candidate division NC10 bacterium]|nr:HAMP domain-containing protein [candidate division NC10 bacterium]